MRLSFSLFILKTNGNFISKKNIFLSSFSISESSEQYILYFFFTKIPIHSSITKNHRKFYARKCFLSTFALLIKLYNHTNISCHSFDTLKLQTCKVLRLRERSFQGERTFPSNKKSSIKYIVRLFLGIALHCLLNIAFFLIAQITHFF